MSVQRMVSPTKMILIRLRRRLGVTKRAHELLEEKRNALVMELYAVLRQMTRLRKDAYESLSKAFRDLVDAEVRLSSSDLRSVSLAVRPCPEIDLKTRRVMGIAVPIISVKDPRRPLSARGYSVVGTSPVVDQVAGSFEDALGRIAEWAESEAAVRRLVVEVEKTKRREMALDKIVIPRLIDTIKYIEFYLEEREREDIFRLKRIRARAEKRGYALTP